MKTRTGWLAAALGLTLVIGLSGAPLAAGQAAASKQRNDDEYTRRIKENTPDPRILTDLVDHMPVSDTVPSPLKFLGYVPGENNRVTYHADIVRYLQALDKASDRVTMWEIGKSEEGRPMVAVAIADEQTIKQLDKYKQITAQLTDPRKITEAQAQQLIRTGKPIYYASGSIHTPEVGSPEMLTELAFRLAVEETPFIQTIRNNAIFVFTPVSEVDGRERMVDGRRAQEAGQPNPGLVYWGKYVQHDNNRDGIGKGLNLTRNMMKSFLDLHPQVLHDLHESVNLLYVSTGHGPYNPIVAPIQVNEWWWLAQTEIMEMTKRGVPGVWTFDYYDGWVPNYMFWIGVTHNSIGRFYETQSYGGGGRAGAPPAAAGATPPATGAAGAAGAGAQPPAQQPPAGRGFGGGTIGGNSREWYRPNPSPGDVRWSGRANINMQQSALLIALNAVAKNREMFLENYYIKNKQMIEQGRNKAPYAYVVPANQRRKVEAADLMNLLRFEGADVSTATSAFTVGDVQVAAGDYVVRMDQPYGGVVETLLGQQWYPADNPSPYDDTGWYIPGLRNIKAVKINDKSVLDKPMSVATADFKVPGVISGTGNTIVIDHTAENTLMTFRFQNKDVKMSAAEAPFDMGGHHFAAGSFIITNANRGALESQIRELGLSAWATSTAPSVAMHDLDVPRIGYIHSWGSTQDEGWVRMALDKLKVPYTYFGENLVRQGNLRAKYDVLLYPHAQVNADTEGMPTTGNPVPYKKTDLTPNIGTAPDQTDDTRGGLGKDGLRELAKFVADGGVVITEGATSTLFPRYQLTTGITIDTPTGFWTCGSVLKAVLTDKTSPIVYGYDQNTMAIMFASSPIFGLGTPSGGAAGGGRGGIQGCGGSGGGRGSNAVDGVGGGNTQPMAAPARLATLDGPAPPAPPAGGGGGRGGFPGGGGRGAGRGGGAGAGDAGAAPGIGPAAFGVPAAGAPRVILSYPSDGNDILLSGGLVGGENIVNRPIVVDSPIGTGHVVMFTNRPFWRFQTQGNFFLAFNAILNWNDLAAK